MKNRITEVRPQSAICLSAGFAFALLACSGSEPGDTPGAAGQATGGLPGSSGSAGSSSTNAGSSSGSPAAGGTGTTGGNAPVAGSAAVAGSASVGGGASGSGNAAGSGGSVAVGGSGGSSGNPEEAIPLDPSLMSRCTGTSPIVCTIPVPDNGNYTVTVELGSASAASTSRVQSELYRISVPPVSLAAGVFEQHTFSLNVREEVHDGYGAPEKELNLLIDGDAPALRGLGYLFTPDIPTIFMAGDSTVCDWEPTYAATKAGPLERGWGQEFSQYLKPGIAVANYADSGESAAGFHGNKFWGPANALLRAGDYVFIQFGHNDTATGTAFQEDMMQYVSDARAKNATPVLFTPVSRKGGAGFENRDQATRDLAEREGVTLVDLTSLTADYYNEVPDKSVLFATASEGTHFSEYGATQVSKLVMDSLKTSTLPLVAFFR